MSKPIIAIDCDEVLMPLHESMLRYHNTAYGTDFQHPDPEGRYYLEHFTGDSHEVSMEKFKTYTLSGAFLETQPIPGAIETIKHLAHRYALVIITGRQDFMEKVTRVTLREHFGLAFTSVHFTPYKGGGKHTSKLQTARQLNINYIIDDNPSIAAECAEVGIEAILFGDYPWNKTSNLPKGVVRCKNWAEVKEYFDARS